MAGFGSYRPGGVGLKRKLLFLLLVALFTLFGGGVEGHWSIVCHDLRGFAYEVNTDSVRFMNDGGINLEVRVAKEGRAARFHWLIDIEKNTLSVDGEPPVSIDQSSVAAKVIRYLRKRRSPLEREVSDG